MSFGGQRQVGKNWSIIVNVEPSNVNDKEGNEIMTFGSRRKKRICLQGDFHGGHSVKRRWIVT